MATLLISQASIILKILPIFFSFGIILVSIFNDFDLILQQSLLLCIYFYLIDFVERFLSAFFQIDRQILMPIFNSTTIALLVSNLIGISKFSLTSTSKSSLLNYCAFGFGLMIQFIEPLLLLIECIQMIQLILFVGDSIRSRIFDDDTDSNGRKQLSFKILTLIITTFSFVGGMRILWHFYHQQPVPSSSTWTIILWKLNAISILIIGIILLLYNLYNEYIIVEASTMYIYLILILFIAHNDFIIYSECSII
ncbi:hypothetical protein SSS_10591 [Sarcoptes scabiei]|nr:hypothetical protein SSS_10591 [Sarcoptes scabiei]